MLCSVFHEGLFISLPQLGLFYFCIYSGIRLTNSSAGIVGRRVPSVYLISRNKNKLFCRYFEYVLYNQEVVLFFFLLDIDKMSSNLFCEYIN